MSERRRVQRSSPPGDVCFRGLSVCMGSCGCVVWLCAVWLCTIALSALPDSAVADDVSGGITKDTTWTSAGNPWTVTGDITVKTGATLTIESGVEVLFDGDYYMWTDSTTSGTIIVQGAIGDSVVFKAASGLPDESQWREIGIFDSPGTSFDYCVVMHAKVGIKLSDSDSPITHCALRHCQTGIWCKRASPPIESSWITDCSFAGILCETRSSLPVIHDCNLYDNPRYNVRLMNYIEAPMVTIDATENWWGTAEEAEIEAGIFHSGDDVTVSYGTVDYENWRNEAPVEEHTWGSIKALFIR